MSRTDQLRGSGRTERGSGGDPFVKWGDSYTWLEGKVVGTWEGKFGLSATMEITAVHDGGLIVQGKNEDSEKYTNTVSPGDRVNVGLNSAALQGKILAEDQGSTFHIAFEGWQDSKNGSTRYRIFSVIELEERERATVPDDHTPQDTTDYSDPGPQF